MVYAFLFIVGFIREFSFLAQGGRFDVGMAVIENDLQVFGRRFGDLGRIHDRVGGGLSFALPFVA